MSQVPLAPPPPTGGPLDSWLYLLWRRLTQAGQILWETITPGTSADVAAVVTDETGSPGSLVFSANPTLTGITVTTNPAYFGGSTPEPLTNGVVVLTSDVTTNTLATFRRSNDAVGTAASVAFIKSHGTAASPTAVSSADNLGAYNFYGHDGTTYTRAGQLLARSDGTISTGVVPGKLLFLTADILGVLREGLAVDNAQAVTLGGPSTSPALKVTPVASQARWVEVTGATSSTNPTIGVSGGTLDITTSVAITGVVSTSGYTVATLPAGTLGDRAYVTDALGPAYGVAVAGGGAVTIPVFYNGAAWICA